MLSSLHTPKSATANSAQQAANYSVSNLPLPGLQNGGDLTFGTADQLTVNGQLKVSNGLVLTPSGAPSTPTAGQIYYDQKTNAPYYYNGSQFVSLGPVAAGQSIQSIGGLSGVVTAGVGLRASGNNLTNSGVLSVQGQTGAVTLIAGNGIVINGRTIAATATEGGITSITGTNGLGVTTAGSSVTVSLPQNISTGASPMFAGLQLGSALPVSSGGLGVNSLAAGGLLVGNGSGPVSTISPSSVGQCLLSNAPGSAPSFAACPSGSGGGNISSGTSQTVGQLTMFDTTSNTITDSLIAELGTTITVNGNLGVTGTLSGDGSGLTGVNADTLNSQAGSFYQNATNLTAGTISDARLGADVTLQGNSFNGSSQLVQTTVGGALPALSGANLTNLNGSAVTSGTVGVANGGTGAGNLTSNGVLYGNGTGAVQATTVGNSGQCLVSNGNGIAPTFQTCTGAVGVSSLNTLTGALSVANASTTGSTIILDDAKADGITKGIATFNSSNFTDAVGLINTVQGIGITATPTFGGLTLTSALTVANGGTGGGTFTAHGVLVGNGTSGLNATTAGSSGQCLVSNGVSSDPTFQTCTGVSTSTLQADYDRSSTPQITLDTSPGAGGLVIRDSAGGVGGNLFAVQNNSGGTSYLAVTTSGASVAGSFSATAGLTITGGAVSLNAGASNFNTSINSGTSTGTISIGNSASTGFSLENGTGVTNLFNGNTAHTINLATGNAVQATTIGSTTTTSSTTIQGGASGSINIGSTNTTAITIGHAGTATLLPGGLTTSNANITTGTGTINTATISGGTLTGTTVNGLNASSMGIDTAAVNPLSLGTVNANGILLGNVAQNTTLTLQGTGLTTLGGNLSFSGTTARVITGPTTSSLTLQGGTSTGTNTGSTVNIIGGSASGSNQIGGNVFLQPGTPTGTGASGSVIVRANTNDSTTAFQVQNAAGTVNLITADTKNLQVIIGSVSNGVTFSAGSYEPILSGTAQHAASVVLPAEYAGAVLDAANDATCSAVTNGTMTSGLATGVTGFGNKNVNFYNWTTAQSSTQCYDVVVEVPVPGDFAAWNGPPTLQVYADSTSNASAVADVTDTAGNQDGGSAFGSTLSPTSASAWQSKSFNSLTGTYTPNQYFTIRIRMSASNNANLRVGSITLNYKSKF